MNGTISKEEMLKLINQINSDTTGIVVSLHIGNIELKRKLDRLIGRVADLERRDDALKQIFKEHGDEY